MARLQERNKALEELADYHRQLLSDSEWRFQEMINQLRQSNDTIATLSRALPEPKDESDDTASLGRSSAGRDKATSPPLVAIRPEIAERGAQARRQICGEQVENRQSDRLMKMQKGRP